MLNQEEYIQLFILQTVLHFMNLLSILSDFTYDISLISRLINAKLPVFCMSISASSCQLPFLSRIFRYSFAVTLSPYSKVLSCSNISIHPARERTNPPLTPPPLSFLFTTCRKSVLCLARNLLLKPDPKGSDPPLVLTGPHLIQDYYTLI